MGTAVSSKTGTSHNRTLCRWPEEVKRWLCRAAKNHAKGQTLGQWLAVQRLAGLDRDNNNLPAAERYQMMVEGEWDCFLILSTWPVRGTYFNRMYECTSLMAGLFYLH